jgi:hypothetical protein
VAVRSPHLHSLLRCYCLGAMSFLSRTVEAGEEIPFAFEEHGSPGRPTLYEYRPLGRAFVERHAERLSALSDAAPALDVLEREPAAAIFAHAHAGSRVAEREALSRAVLLPLAADIVDACGGVDWDDSAFERAYAALERSLFGSERAYAAVAPLAGVSVGAAADLGGGLRVRAAATGELSAHWAEATRLLPPGFGREPDRLCVLEVEASLGPGRDPPDAPAEVADAVSALRLATAASVSAGPVLFERLDWRPFGIRPVLPIAAAQPPGEPTRLDAVRARLAARVRMRLTLADGDEALGEALDRWELSLFQPEAFQAEQLPAALDALLGGGDGAFAAALRAAVLLGESGRERAEVLRVLRPLVRGEGAAGPAAADAVRRTLVEVLLAGERRRLVEALDDSLLGLRPRPASGLAVEAVPL